MGSAKSCSPVMLMVVGVAVLVALSASMVVAETTYPVQWGTRSTLANVVGDWVSHLSRNVAVTTIEVGDTLRFEYSSDNLLEVSRAAIKKCDTSAPLRLWTDGDTSITFLEEGVFFFISGTSERCLRNQRLVVKVTEHHDAKEQRPHRRMAHEATEDACNKYEDMNCL